MILVYMLRGIKSQCNHIKYETKCNKINQTEYTARVHIKYKVNIFQYMYFFPFFFKIYFCINSANRNSSL